jgi:hypothetical protein
MTVATGSALTLLMSRIIKYQSIAEQINQACVAKQCPPAFDIQLSPNTESEDIHIRASKDYRFKGFGAVVSLRPKMSFWVEHMPPDAEPVEIGRFLIPVGFGDLMHI